MHHTDIRQYIIMFISLSEVLVLGRDSEEILQMIGETCEHKKHGTISQKLQSTTRDGCLIESKVTSELLSQPILISTVQLGHSKAVSDPSSLQWDWSWFSPSEEIPVKPQPCTGGYNGILLLAPVELLYLLNSVGSSLWKSQSKDYFSPQQKDWSKVRSI